MKEILDRLQQSDKPVTKIIQKSDSFKLIGLGLKKDVLLKEHKAPGRTKLMIVKGKVSYTTNEKELILDTLDQYDIPLEEIHAVKALEDSICLLIVG